MFRQYRIPFLFPYSNTSNDGLTSVYKPFIYHKNFDMIEKKSYEILERRVREVTIKNYRRTLPISSKLYRHLTLNFQSSGFPVNIKRKMHEEALKKNMDRDD